LVSSYFIIRDKHADLNEKVASRMNAEKRIKRRIKGE